MQKLKIATKHEAGIFDFFNTLTKGNPTIPAEKQQEFQEFKNKVLKLYTRLNNAYKLYFLGAALKQNQKYEIQEYKDKDGNIQQKKVPVENSGSTKINFQGKWKFKLSDGSTYLGKAIQALYKFLTALEKVKVKVKPEVGKEQTQQKEAPQQQEQQPTQEQKTPAQENQQEQIQEGQPK